MQKNSPSNQHSPKQLYEQYQTMIASLRQMQGVAKMVLSDSKKKMNQFEKQWVKSEEMQRLNALNIKIDRVAMFSSYELVHTQKGQQAVVNIKEAVSLVGILLTQGESLLLTLTGQTKQSQKQIKKHSGK